MTPAPVPERKEQRMSFPQHLVGVVRAQLRSEFWPGANDDDACLLLKALAEAGVEFPAAPDPVPVWVVRGDGLVLCRSEAVTESVDCARASGPVGAPLPNPELAERVAHHLNGDCTRPYEHLAGVVQAFLDDGDHDDEHWATEIVDAIRACQAAEANDA